MTQTLRPNQLLLLCTLILLLTGALRIIGMAWALPYQLNPDEPVLFINAWELWHTGSIRLMSDYPPLYIYILAFQREVIYRLFGADTSQVIYFFFGRWNSILISLLLVAVAYRLGRRIAGIGGGLAFMSLLAVEPISALDQGWIIKSDSLAWLFSLLTLFAAYQSSVKRSWRWWAVALLCTLLATFTKYNMLFIAAAPAYALLYLLTKRAWLSSLLITALLFGALFGAWAVIKLFWVDSIAPAFAHCSGDSEEIMLAVGYDLDKIVPWLPCAPFRAFQRFTAPFYERDAFFDAVNLEALRYIFDQIRQNFLALPLALGLGAVLLALIRPKSEHDPIKLGLISAVLAPSLFLLAMFGEQYPIRQYYVVILSLLLLIAWGIGKLWFWQPRLGVLCILLMIAPHIWQGFDYRAELRKPDSRAATADYLLAHAPQGAAVIVEYDNVEFAEQYGGFPAQHGYFNILPVLSAHEYELDSLIQQGIAYVVVDSRSAQYGGYYADAGVWPEHFALLATLEGADYFGPDRRIYQTFSPETILEANFNGLVRLYGYDLAQDGQELNLTLYWQALSANLPDYSLFLHIFDPQTAELVFQADAPPEKPSRLWTLREWIFDERELHLDLAAGTYQVYIGLYDPISQSRVPIDGQPDGRLELAPIMISPHNN